MSTAMIGGRTISTRINNAKFTHQRHQQQQQKYQWQWRRFNIDVSQRTAFIANEIRQRHMHSALSHIELAAFQSSLCLAFKLRTVASEIKKMKENLILACERREGLC